MDNLFFMAGVLGNVMIVLMIVTFRWRFVKVRNAGGSGLYTDGGVHPIPEEVGLWKKS